MAKKPAEEYEEGERVTVLGRPGRIAPEEAQRVGDTWPVDLDDGTRIDAEERHIERIGPTESPRATRRSRSRR